MIAIRSFIVTLLLAGYVLTVPFARQAAAWDIYEPLFGFVTVPGHPRGDDVGADPRVLGNVLRHSNVTCLRTSLEELEATPLAGRLGIGYIWGSIEEKWIELYNREGYFHFIFENEPDGTAAANPLWAEQYMARLNATYPRVKAVSPDNKIIGGNLLTPNFDKFYALGFKDSSDIVGYHNYSNDPRSGINMAAIPPIREQMEEAGDGDKLIFLGEGWGPARELPGLKRMFPDAGISAQELQMLRDFVVNGYWSIVTPRHNYKPEWIMGVLFFTLNDNWGGQGWAARAQPRFDDAGRVTTYFVDGYDVGLNIFPTFYNGGLVDHHGNAKDNLLDIFPGNGLALANSGFEHYEPLKPRLAASWLSTSPDNLFQVDHSVYRGGSRSQRITLDGRPVVIFQDTLKRSVAQSDTCTIRVWVRGDGSQEIRRSGAYLEMEFRTPGGVELATARTQLKRVGDSWQSLEVSGVAPPGSDHIRVRFGTEGGQGTLWLDDFLLWKGKRATGTINGYVLDEERRVVPGAVVATETGGYRAIAGKDGFFEIGDVQAGVYHITAQSDGYTSHTVLSQVVIPGRVRAMGFTLHRVDDTLASALRVTDPAVGETLKIEFTPPAGAYDHLRIYRSTDPGQLGELAADNVQGSPYYDTGLQDGIRYSYTIRTVKDGKESDNNNHAYGIPTGGITVNAYSAYPVAMWGHFGDTYGQTFKAPFTGHITSASAMPGFAGGPAGTELTFTFYEDGPGGRQIGPAGTVAAAGNAESTATWPAGALPVEEGRTYYMRLTGAREFTAYRGGQTYPDGEFYIDDKPVHGSDIWGTIRVVKPGPVKAEGLKARLRTSGEIEVRWTTVAPVDSVLEVMLPKGDGWQAFPARSEDGKIHSVTLPGESRDATLRVRTVREGLPEGVSLEYPLRILLR